MKLFLKIGFCLILCAVFLSGCLSNDSSNSNDSVAINPEMDVFSGHITELRTVGDDLYLTVENENISHYGQTKLYFIVNNETVSNFYVADTYYPEEGRFIYLRFTPDKINGVLSPAAVTHATLFYEGTEFRMFNGTIEDIYINTDSERWYDGAFLVDNTYFKFSSSTYFSENITEGMDVLIYAEPLILTTSPAQGWAYEVWLSDASTSVHLDNTDQNSINPLNKKIEPYSPGSVPYEDNIVFETWSNYSTVGYSNETLLPEADIAFYGTVETINPSVWTTSNQEPPSGLYGAVSGKGGYGSEDGTYIEYDLVSISGCDDYICTPVVFDIDYLIKGENVTEVTVIIQSGQIGNYISVESAYPLIWDLNVGQQYLVYLKNYGTEENSVMYPGFFVVLE
ncbi:hypothetical protein MmiHf6_16370 [Methanimicrococcus hongohii]|uniref:Uncharacterized protein n=1 Tax=Methanimicrococcus hongohii TaxID=3028295 RepID=A0AA96ZUG5_9EURY|nr:hypothetical protein [Methanimicrococcus sp. Hf6]WNY24306.1 hypothetical protein MmiHf6_16370 [Methanimicrococcus sp. Hf6]